ncbi:MAG: hypothetical protein KJZ98_00420 [Burkholderiaceae bacterium]|nr:hypothetical protein [Burkholderiaceae bacterium]MEB2350301.1 hypothetical protein [Burkholderiaceae bacterium]
MAVVAALDAAPQRQLSTDFHKTLIILDKNISSSQSDIDVLTLQEHSCREFRRRGRAIRADPGAG